MILNLLTRGPLRAPEGEPTGGGGTGDPPADPPPVDPPTGDPPPVVEPPAPISMTSEQLNDRMARERTAYLARLGVGTEVELQALVERDRAATEAAEAARRETQTNEQRLQEDLSARTVERDAALADADDQRFQGHVAGVCAASGVSNVPYAQYEIARAAEALPDGEDLDVQAWLDERMDPENAEHASIRGALGVAEAPVVAPAPTTTVVDPHAPPPAPPPPGGNPPAADDAFRMTPEEWRLKQEALGIG